MIKPILYAPTPIPEVSNRLEPEQLRLMILEAECLSERDLGRALNAAFEAAEVAESIKDRLSGTHALLLAGQCALKLGLYDDARGALFTL